MGRDPSPTYKLWKWRLKRIVRLDERIAVRFVVQSCNYNYTTGLLVKCVYAQSDHDVLFRHIRRVLTPRLRTHYSRRALGYIIIFVRPLCVEPVNRSSNGIACRFGERENIKYVGL